MNRLLRRVTNNFMHAFAGSGVELDEQGRLCLPDGLCSDRMHRFIELCMDERFASPRDALHALFRRVGVDAKAVGLLDRIIDEQGTVELGEAVRHAGALLRAVPALERIPERFRLFLVDDLDLASGHCPSLEAAVESTRLNAAERLGCEPTWDAILGHADALIDWTRPWRERSAAA